jgi:hypothetical protein
MRVLQHYGHTTGQTKCAAVVLRQTVSLDPQNVGITILRNVGNYIPTDIA